MSKEILVNTFIEDTDDIKGNPALVVFAMPSSSGRCSAGNEKKRILTTNSFWPETESMQEKAAKAYK
jgi:hypothetical protein